ncbi:hypothetical protein TNCV_1169371 [Trichonephila clavipes]|uniref:Uncharacterized protein n=1 Tax=Trichonephila clavipes TaxID=2585209 RepID=A0A8X6T1Y5_TRICX|nr:hypothetical protein TNCV_1169371 [Trichonephila clavipes]
MLVTLSERETISLVESRTTVDSYTRTSTSQYRVKESTDDGFPFHASHSSSERIHVTSNHLPDEFGWRRQISSK